MTEFVEIELYPMAEVCYYIQMLRNALPPVEDMCITTDRDRLVGFIDNNSDRPNTSKLFANGGQEACIHSIPFHFNTDVVEYLKRTITTLFEQHVVNQEEQILLEVHKHYDNQPPDFPYEACRRPDYSCYQLTSDTAYILSDLISRRNAVVRIVYELVMDELVDYIHTNVDTLSSTDFIIGLRKFYAEIKRYHLQMWQFNKVFENLEFLYGISEESKENTSPETSENDNVRTYIHPKYEYFNNTTLLSHYNSIIEYMYGSNVFKVRHIHLFIKLLDHIKYTIEQFCDGKTDTSMTAYIRKDLYDLNVDLLETIRNDQVIGTRRTHDSPTSCQSIYSYEDYSRYYLDESSRPEPELYCDY